MNKLIILSLALCSWSSCTPHTSRNHEDRISLSLDSIGHNIMDQEVVLGFSIAIDSAGSTMYSGSFGHLDAEQTIPVHAGTRFDMASVSKMVGVSIIMRLVEEGTLNLDQTLDELLPDFPEKKVASTIRLTHLISHTSGLLDYTMEIDSLFNEGIPITDEHFLRFFQDQPLLFEPGSNYQYCNSGFMLMALIAENVTQKTWQELIDEIINRPSGLDMQLIRHAVNDPEYSRLYRVQQGHYEAYPDWTYVIGDGGMTTSAIDLSLFPRLLSQGNLLSKSSFDQMVTPQPLNDQIRTGYGLGVRNGLFLGEKVIGHTGGWNTTYALVAHFPELDLTFAGLMNTDGGPITMNDIFASFMSEFLHRSIPDYTSPTLQFDDPEQLVGNYHGYGVEFDNIGTTVTIQLDDQGQLFYCVAGACDRMYYLGEHRFWLERYPYDLIEFQLNEQASAIREYYHGFFQVLRKKVQ